MESKDITSKVEEQEKSKTINSINIFNNLKNDYFILKLFEYMSKRQSLETIRRHKWLNRCAMPLMLTKKPNIFSVLYVNG